MKLKIFALMLCAVLCLSLTSCGAPEPSECIKDISLTASENGTSYYDVYLTADIEWAELTSGSQSDIALYAINECRSRAAALGDECMVTGWYDGVIAFSWGGVDGDLKIRMYDEEGRFEYTWALTTDDLEN